MDKEFKARDEACGILTEQMQPGRWWKVLDADDNLLLESSNERECRNEARRTKGATLHRSFHIELAEWRRVVPK